MITQQQITEWTEAFIADSDYLLQSVEIDSDNNITVEIDRPGIVDMDFCAALNRHLFDKLGDENYSIEVGSVSLTAPFRSRLQYDKHVGHAVEVITGDGEKLHGLLVSADDDSFAVDVERMVAVEGKKRRQKQITTLSFPYTGVKQVRYDLKV